MAAPLNFPLVYAVNSKKAARLAVVGVCIQDNSLWRRKRYSVSHSTCLWSARYARRSSKQQYAVQSVTWYMRMDVSWRVEWFPHLPTGYACAFPFLLDSRVLTCDMTGEHPPTSSGCCWLLVRWPATLSVAGQSSLTSSLLVTLRATVGRQLLLLGLVDEQGHSRTLLQHLDK
jgi:hypothetical protein